MSISGVLLVAITTSFLKPLLSTNESLHAPSVDVYDNYNGISPFEEKDFPSDGATNFFLTLRLPQLLSDANDDFDIKRQFDPWGGKRYSKPITKDEDLGRKRQFSPWGGKRSYLENISLDDKDYDFNDADSQTKNSISQENKKGFSALNTKRGFNSWGGKRNANANDAVGKFKLRDGEQSLKFWVEKKNFKPWGGKRSVENSKEMSDAVYELNKNSNSGGKRQNFHAWGGKRGFNSWGGKRGFNSWGGKRSFNSWNDKRDVNFSDDKREISSWGGKRPSYINESKAKGQNNPGESSGFSSYNAAVDDTQRYLR